MLLDASVDARTLEKIRAIIMEAPEVASLTELVARNSGRYIFVQANLIFRVTDLERERILPANVLRQRSVESFLMWIACSFITSTQARKSLRYAAPLKDARGTLGEHFGESPYFALVEIDLQEMKLAKQEIVANPYKDLAKGKGLKVAKFLLTYKPDVILCEESLSDKGPGYVFAEAGVKTSQTGAKILEELVNGLLEAKGEDTADN